MKKKTTKKPSRREAKTPLISTKRLSKQHLTVFALIFAAIGSYLVWSSFASSDATPKPFTDKPEHGLIWAGLRSPHAGSVCAHMFEVANVHAGVPMCTHGPDPAPESLDVHKSVEPVRTGESDRTAADAGSTASTTTYPLIPCDGDGSTGNRIQGLYVRASDVTSRFSTFAESFQIYAMRANNQYVESAKDTGVRNLRWVHDANCKPIISEVVISPTGDDDFNNTINELNNLGYNRTDRKYMLWVDATVYCGIGTIKDDDSAGSNNSNNVGPSYGRSDSGCWNYSEAHELMHNLGGVQLSAPHSTKGWHCTDEADEMCYVDGAGVVMTNTCPYTNNQSILFDCNHDDYYYAGVPPAGNYLLDHWNTANSNFLIGGAAPPPTPTSQCGNRVDDDVDGKIDYPADPGCSSASDTSESPDPGPPPDTVAPSVSIVGPINNTTVKRIVDIYANGADNVGVTKMEIYLDGVPKATTTASPISYSWNASKASRGVHIIVVKAYDAAGNVGQSSVTVVK